MELSEKDKEILRKIQKEIIEPNGWKGAGIIEIDKQDEEDD